MNIKRQSGFILPSGLTLYIAIGAAVIIAGLSIAVKVQSSRLASVKAEYAGFVAQTKAIGEIQEAKTRETEAKHTEIVKEKDHENFIAHTKLADVSKRLRLSTRSGSGLLPPATDPTSSTEKACFNRAKLDNSLRDFTGNIGELIIECQGNTIDLDTAKQWVKSLNNQ